jgi:membrane fusion protein (multidrug efflux system)
MSIKSVISLPCRGIKRIWPKNPKARVVTIVVIILLVFALVFGVKITISTMVSDYMATHSLFPPPPVTVAKAKAQTWRPYISSVGQVMAIQGTNISPQVSGIVTKLSFKSGDMVKAGQVLAQLDIDVLKAQLAQYQASANLSLLDYRRQQRLYQQHVTSAQSLDQASAQYNEDRAQVQQYRQLIAQKIIRAPFSGMIGIRQVSLGQYLSAGTAIASLQMLAPIYVNYTIAEQDVDKIHVGQPVEVTVGAYPKDIFKGEITALDSVISNDTKSIQVQATFPNHDLKLKPGMFTIVHTLLPQQEHVVTVPQSAINYTLYGDSIFVIKRTSKDGKPATIAMQKYVQLGEQRFNQVAVKQGIKAGEEIVTTGQMRLSNNTPVAIQAHGIEMTSE